MIDFIKIPNLPEGKVATVICGTNDEEILSYFSRNRISIIKNAPNLGGHRNYWRHRSVVDECYKQQNYLPCNTGYEERCLREDTQTSHLIPR